MAALIVCCQGRAQTERLHLDVSVVLMPQEPRILQGALRDILKERFGPLRILGAVGPVCRAVAIDPRPFFGAIGSEPGVRIGNAVAFFVASLILYVTIQTLFEQFLIQFMEYDAQSLIAYYAAPFADYGLPLSQALGFVYAALDVALISLFVVVYWAVSIWFFAHSFFHFGQIASLRSLFVASLYAIGAAVLMLCFLSLPAAYFDSRNLGSFDAYQNVSLEKFASVVSVGGLQAKYEALFLYVYLRSVSFTSDLKLHWALIFCALFFYGVALAISF